MSETREETIRTVFVDADGNTWPIRITFGAIRRIKQNHGVDLGNLLSGETFQKLATDQRLTVDLLTDLTAADRAIDEIDDEAFLDLLDGQALQAGAEAIAEAAIQMASPKIRDSVRKVRERVDQALAEAEAAKVKALSSQQVDRHIERAIDQAYDRALQDLGSEG